MSLLMWKLRSLIEIDTVEYMENVPACMENYVSGNRCIVDGLDSAISFGILKVSRNITHDGFS